MRFDIVIGANNIIKEIFFQKFKMAANMTAEYINVRNFDAFQSISTEFFNRDL